MLVVYNNLYENGGDGLVLFFVLGVIHSVNCFIENVSRAFGCSWSFLSVSSFLDGL